MMESHLGRTGLLVSRLCLGTMAFGNSTDEKASFRIMDEALDLGINFFDSADNYGKATNNEGITEKIIGKWFAQGGGRRQKVVLTTKVHEEMHDPNDGPNSPGGLHTKSAVISAPPWNVWERIMSKCISCTISTAM